MHICLYVFAYVHTYVHTCVYMYLRTYTYIHMDVLMCMYVCMNVHINFLLINWIVTLLDITTHLLAKCYITPHKLDKQHLSVEKSDESLVMNHSFQCVYVHYLHDSRWIEHSWVSIGKCVRSIAQAKVSVSLKRNTLIISNIIKWFLLTNF